MPHRWSDGFVEWCGCTFPEAFRLAVNRQDSRDKVYEVTGLNGPGNMREKKRIYHSQNVLL